MKIFSLGALLLAAVCLYLLFAPLLERAAHYAARLLEHPALLLVGVFGLLALLLVLKK